MTGHESDNSFSNETLGEEAAKTKRSEDRRFSRAVLKNIRVTQEDIDRAKPENSRACMISDAIKRQHPEFKNVETDLATIRWSDTKKRRRVLCLTPLRCQQALTAFDLGIPPAPFTFDVVSTRVTKMAKSEPRRDAEGNLVMKSVVTKKRGKDGVVREYVNERVAQKVVEWPSERVVVENRNGGKPSADHLVGGKKFPIRHAPSVMRKFGLKAFTWEEGENVDDVIDRQRKAYGETGLKEISEEERNHLREQARLYPGLVPSKDSI